MSSEMKPKKIGGEYGEVRANIDVETLNTYLAKNIEAITTPVDVKQFKVGYVSVIYSSWHVTDDL